MTTRQATKERLAEVEAEIQNKKVLDVERFLRNLNLCLIPIKYFTSYNNVKSPINCYDVIINKNKTIEINNKFYYIPSCFVYKNKVFSNEEMFKEFKHKSNKKQRMEYIIKLPINILNKYDDENIVLHVSSHSIDIMNYYESRYKRDSYIDVEELL